MKLVGLLPLLSGTAFAGLAQIQSDLEELAKNSTNRNVQITLGGTFNQINAYGCWCYFHADGALQGELDNRRGRGRPVDVMDSFCRDLTWGYDCILMQAADENWIQHTAFDSANNGADCVPWETFYVSGIGSGLNFLNLICEQVNGQGALANNGVDTECAIAACKVEGLFVFKLFEILNLANGIDAQYHEDNGFVQEGNCPTIVGGGPADRECCGSYPYRRPFHTRSGVNECCTDDAEFVQVYQPLTHDCCTTHLVPFGDTC